MFDKIASLVNSKYLHYFVFIMLLIFLLFMVVLPFVSNDCESLKLECRWATLMETWRQWQTFNASIIAFISTILVIYSTTITERNNQFRKRNVARAFLSNAISDLSNQIEEFILIFDNISQGKLDSSKANKPIYPSEVLMRIEKFIEVSEPKDKLLVDHLVIFINSLQIYHSRLSSLIQDNWTSNKKQGAFYQINQCIRLHALLSGMYDFARGKEDIYQAEYLNKERFWIKNLPLYMTNIDMEKYSKQKISIELFCSD